MSKQFGIFLAIGIVVVAVALFFILYGNKGSHLELKGEIIKVRTGAIDDNNSAAVLDFRVQNTSDVPLVVRTVTVTAEEPNGDNIDGDLISKRDIGQLLAYNRFLGQQYNEGLSIKDTIAPHQQVDRMVAVRFEVPQSTLDKARQLRLRIEDMDGPTFDFTKSVK